MKFVIVSTPQEKNQKQLRSRLEKQNKVRIFTG